MDLVTNHHLRPGLSEEPTAETKYVVMEHYHHGNRFITSWLKGDTRESKILGDTGRIWYEILVFANNLAAAHKFLGVSVCCNEQW